MLPWLSSEQNLGLEVRNSQVPFLFFFFFPSSISVCATADLIGLCQGPNPEDEAKLVILLLSLLFI